MGKVGSLPTTLGVSKSVIDSEKFLQGHFYLLDEYLFQLQLYTGVSHAKIQIAYHKWMHQRIKKYFWFSSKGLVIQVSHEVVEDLSFLISFFAG